MKDAKDIAKEVRKELKEKGIKGKVRVHRYKTCKDLVSVDLCPLTYNYSERLAYRISLGWKSKYSNELVDVL